jgi:hypothetical protein
MKNFFILVGICIIACSADTIIAPYPDINQSLDRIDQSIEHVDSQSLSYEDVTDENITAAILQAADQYDLNDVELQAVLDNYAD